MSPQKTKQNKKNDSKSVLDNENIEKKTFSDWMKSMLKPKKLKSPLTTDAVVLPENNGNVDDSPERLQSNTLSISSLSPEVAYQDFDSQPVMPFVGTNESLVERSNNTTAVSNIHQVVVNVRDVTGFVLGNNYHITNTVPSDPVHKIKKTKSIDLMMKSNDPINEKTIDVISANLGKNWQDLFRALGYSTGQIDTIRIDYQISLKETIFRLLLDYSRNNEDASLGHITRIMWEKDFRECVTILKDHWKVGGLDDGKEKKVGGKGKVVE